MGAAVVVELVDVELVDDDEDAGDEELADDGVGIVVVDVAQWRQRDIG